MAAHGAARLALEALYRSEDSGPGEAPSIDMRFQTPGLGSLSLLLARGSISLDTRDEGERSGVCLDARATLAVDTAMEARRFVVSEVEVKDALEVGRADQVLAGALYLAEAHAFDREPVPFTHLPDLDLTASVGNAFGEHLRGFAVEGLRFLLAIHREP